MEILAGLCCVLVIAVVVIGFILRRYDDYRFRKWVRGPAVQVVCLHCQGKGWTTKTVRTLDFDGTGFVDAETPAQPCPACHGTGTVTR